MNIRFDNKGDLIVCYMEGEIDINTAPSIKKSFEKVLQKQAKKVIINFKGVTYIDSSGLATLVEILKNMKQYGGRLRLTNLTSKIKSLFEITKLDRLFEILPEEEEALSSFSV